MSFLYFFDLFGVEKNFKIMGKEKFNTKFSSMLSILLIILLIYKLQNIIRKVITKKSYTLKTKFISDPNLSINITNFQFAVCSSSPDYSKFYDWSDDYSIKFIHMDFLGKTKKEFPITSHCDSEKLKIFNYQNKSKYEFNKCLCYKIENNIVLTTSNELSGKNYGITIESKNRTDKILNILFYYVDNYFNYDNYEHFNKVINYHAFILSDMKLYYQEIYFNLLSYIDDAFDYELFESEGTNNSIYSISEKNYITITDPNEIFKDSIWLLSFRCNNKEIKNEVTLFSLDYIFAAFGGFFQLFQSVFSIICTTYNEKCMGNTILDYFLMDFTKSTSSYKIIDSFRNTNRDNINLIKINKPKVSVRMNTRIKSKYDNHDMLEKIYNKFDFHNFIKLFSDINVLKKLIVSNEHDHKLFDLVSHYYTFDLIKPGYYLKKKDFKISLYLQSIIDDIEM